MKTTRDLLKETFASIPNKFAYREVKFHIYHALQKLETLEKRETVKQKQEQEQKIREEEKRTQAWMPPIYQTSYQAKNTLDIIDKMIAEEKKVIEEVQRKKGKITKSETKDDDEDDGLQTLHG
jgi:hypothetical protein